MLNFVPLKYNMRNLGRRPLRTALTVFGIGLVVFGCVLMHAFAEGLGHRQIKSASESNVIILSAKVGDDITMSSISRGAADTLGASFSGIKEEYGHRLISPEVYYGAKIKLDESEEDVHLGVIRGVTSSAFKVHPQVNIVAGKEPSHGREIMIGKLVAAQMGVDKDRLAIGSRLFTAENNWEIVGVFEAPGTVFESEIWCDVDDLIVATKRDEFSVISMVLEDQEAVEDVKYFCDRRLDLEVKAYTETEFYASLADSMRSMGIVVYVMLGLIVFGGVLGGTNTMYAAVLGRFREFGTLRILGFNRTGIFLGLCIESIILAICGGILGSVLARLVNDHALRIPMGAVSLRIGTQEMLLGIGLGIVIGLTGAIVPGIRSAKMSTVDSIRAV